MDDATLLSALATDLDAAFETLVRARQDRLYSIALRLLGDPDEAEDAAQDTFIRAYRALGTWDRKRILELRLDAWLATIVVNAARSRLRRRTSGGRRESLTFLDELDHPAAARAEGPEAHLARREAETAWSVRLLALPERYRAPIVLRHVDGLGYDEIGAALDRPEGTVKAQVHRGLALLRAMVDAEARADREPPMPPSPRSGLSDGRDLMTTSPPELQEIRR
jgi:RNA polymerase sigma-70 factor, ECF subfamily